MPRLSKSAAHRARVMSQAWEIYRPGKRYSALTLEEFREAMRPCLEIREVIRDLQRQLREAFERRKVLDVAAGRVQRRVVYCVRADPEDGEDSAIYVAMGFVAKSGRRRPGKKGAKKEKRARST